MSSKLTTEEFIRRSKLIHGEKYSYKDSVYTNSNTKVKIICTLHGAFYQVPSSHCSRRSGCPKCKWLKIAVTVRNKFTTNFFIKSATEVHGTKYDYSLAEYVSAHKKIKIICKVHGVFEQSHANHTAGKGCPRCTINGYNRAKAGYLYALVSASMTKVGITNRELCIRVAEISRHSGRKFNLVFSRFFEDGKIPYQTELQILKELRLQYQQTQEVFDGSTECFLNVDTKSLIARINELLT